MKTIQQCNHDCNQGRNCTCRKQRGEITVTTLILISMFTSLIPFFVQLTAKPDPRCWGGWLYDGMNGRKIFNESGGGIRCNVDSSVTKITPLPTETVAPAQTLVPRDGHSAGFVILLHLGANRHIC